ncbi:MAG: hypothetical protein ACRDL7_15390, partial [Gaiellaceae bacterium]
AHTLKLITGGWDDATNAIADWDLALLPVSGTSESSRHPLAVKSRETGCSEMSCELERLPLRRGTLRCAARNELRPNDSAFLMVTNRQG